MSNSSPPRDWESVFQVLVASGYELNRPGRLIKLNPQKTQAAVLYRPGQSRNALHMHNERASRAFVEALQPHIVRRSEKPDRRGWEYYDVNNWDSFLDAVLSSMQENQTQGAIENFQDRAGRTLAQTARELHLDPYSIVESGNGTEFKNHLNDTVFTVYHRRLDPANQDRVEIAIGIENITTEHGFDSTRAADWFSHIQLKYHEAVSKSPQWWPRVALWSMDEVLNFQQDLRSFLSPTNRAEQGTEAKPLATKRPLNEPVDERVLQQILTRRGQAAFRSALLAAYGSACAVSRCTDEAVLEAAHIAPHAEAQDYRSENGLLLRADIHTLFDLRLLSVDPRSGVIVVSARLGPIYQAFAGQRLRLPASPTDQPEPAALLRHFGAWQVQEAQ